MKKSYKCHKCGADCQNPSKLGRHYAAYPKHRPGALVAKRRARKIRLSDLPTTGRRAAAASLRYCVQCGARSGHSWRYCGHCGAALRSQGRVNR